jgi:DNA-directed RNA polymerase subunit H (RpoH/RPB5)
MQRNDVRCVEHVFMQISPSALPVLFNSQVLKSFPEVNVKSKSEQFQVLNLHYLQVKCTKLPKISTNCSTITAVPYNYIKGWAGKKKIKKNLSSPLLLL